MGFAGGEAPLRHAQAAWASFEHPLGAVSPGGRYGHSVAWAADYGVLLVFGGWMAGSRKLSSALWAFAPSMLLEGEVQGEAEGTAEETIFEGLDGAGEGAWGELAVTGGPCPRYGLQLAWFAGQVYVMGGYTALHEPLTDLWRLTLPERSMRQHADPLAALAASRLSWAPLPFVARGPAMGAAVLVSDSLAYWVAEASDPTPNVTAASECEAQGLSPCPLTECVGVQCVWTADVASASAVADAAEAAELLESVCASSASPLPTLAQGAQGLPAPPRAAPLESLSWGFLRNGCALPWLEGTLCRWGAEGSAPLPEGIEAQPPSPFYEATATWANGTLILFGGARYNESTGGWVYQTSMWAYSPEVAASYWDTQVSGYKRLAVRNISTNLAQAQPEDRLLIDGTASVVIAFTLLFFGCCGCPIFCLVVRVRGLRKRKRMQAEANTSRKDARMVKDQEEQRARDAARKQRLALADARARDEDATQPLAPDQSTPRGV